MWFLQNIARIKATVNANIRKIVLERALST